MGNIYEEVKQKAKRFMYTNARPLDLARWKFHFEGGSREEVLEILSAYQNGDGGFGHGLEADSLNPNSAPVQTYTAISILAELGMVRKEYREHPVIQGLAAYLESGRDFEDGRWVQVVESNNDYPHAPWWSYPQHMWGEGTAREQQIQRYNPSAGLAGFALVFAQPDSRLRKRALALAEEAVKAMLAWEGKMDMHVLSCFCFLGEMLQKTGLSESIGVKDREITEKLSTLVKETITQDKKAWENSYICRPSGFIRQKDSLYYETFLRDNREIAEYECTFIKKMQLEDGTFDVPWGWADYPESWAVSRQHWKGCQIVENLLYLKGMGKKNENDL